MSVGFFEAEIKAIVDSLWSPLNDGSRPNVYMVIDCARDKRLEKMIRESQLEQSCLYSGTISYALKRAAPHIVKLTPDSTFTKELLSIGWGESWGVFFITPPHINMATVRINCKKISKIQTPDNKILVFRYQDPRVLRRFLPICDPQQLRQIFGNAFVIAMENEFADQLIRYNVDITRQKLYTNAVDVCERLV